MIFLLNFTQNNTTPSQKPEISVSSDTYTHDKYDEYLILVNNKNPLDKSYKPYDLVKLKNTRDDGRPIQYARAECAKALEAMVEEMKKSGIWDEKMSVTSAYRSYEYQEYLFGTYIENRIQGGMNYDEAYKDVRKTVAMAGTSEHQSGLCIDFHNKSYANASFADTEQYRWIEENAHKFGFIIRYPKGKEAITGISFEPWHLRYIGEYHATKMHETNVCLEEYVL